MVDLMEFPEDRDLVGQVVIEPVGELVGQEEHDRDDGPADALIHGDRRRRSERPIHEIRDGATDLAR
jgi:hypothetical protein